MLRIGTTVAKDPNDQRFYVIDWSDDLDGLVITASAWSVDTGDGALILSDPSIITGGQKTQVKISGGTTWTAANPVLYKVSNRITISGAPTQQAEKGFTVKVVEQ